MSHVNVAERFSLAGQVALVTGAGKGIGRACALVRRASGLWVLLAMLSSGLRG